MCRSRRELSNAYLLAKIGVDTAENEPLDVWRENSIQYSLHSLGFGRRGLGRERLWHTCARRGSGARHTYARRHGRVGGAGHAGGGAGQTGAADQCCVADPWIGTVLAIVLLMQQADDASTHFRFTSGTSGLNSALVQWPRVNDPLFREAKS